MLLKLAKRRPARNNKITAEAGPLLKAICIGRVIFDGFGNNMPITLPLLRKKTKRKGNGVRSLLYFL